jgi:ribosomal-protein-alanine N-acetyltransferase
MPDIKIQCFTPDSRSYEIERLAHAHPWSLSVFCQSHGPAYYNRQLVVDEETVGYIICQQVLDELTIFNIAIDPKHQGQGFSHYLMQDTLNYAANNGMLVFLEVRASNTPAISLYQTYGFRELAKRADYYKTRSGYEDALVMKWQSEQN